jgi:hypothetical protein
MFFWVRLYVLRSERDNTLALVHGYAVQTITPDTASGTSTHWSRKNLHRQGNRWTLRRYTRLMTAEELSVWVDALSQTEKAVLPTNEGDHRVRVGRLITRPPVYAAGRGAPGGLPQSPSSDLAILETLWEVDTQALLGRLFPGGEYTFETRMDALVCLLDLLESETGIRFRGDEAGRLGNVEVVRYPLGSYEVPGGLCIGLGDDLLVWVRPPLSGEGDLLVNCRLYSGGVVDSDGQEHTIILDEVRRWPPDGDDAVLRFAPREQFGRYEVSVWRAGDGALLARERGSPLNHIGLSMATPGPVRRARTPWTEERLPSALREHAATRRLSGRAGPFMSGKAGTPWITAEQELRQVVAPLFPRPGEGRFFTPQPDRVPQLVLVDYLVEQVERHGVERAVLADPYFGTQALWMLIPRLQAVGRLTIVTSVAGDEAHALRGACQQNRSRLGFRIINVTTASGGDGQFHDRYLVLELASGEREVLILSSSLNYGSTERNPIAVVPLAPHLSWQVARYVSGLVRGQIEGRSDLRTPPEVLCEPLPPGVRDQEIPTSGLCPFTDWEVILQLLHPAELPLLVNGTPDGDRQNEHEMHGASQVDEHDNITTGSIGFLVHDPVAGETRWELPTAARRGVADRIVQRLAEGVSTYEKVLPTFADWAYRSGPKQEDYAFGAQATEAVEEALVHWLRAAEEDGREHRSIAALAGR